MVLQVFRESRSMFVKITGCFNKIVISRVGRGEENGQTNTQTHALLVWEVGGVAVWKWFGGVMVVRRWEEGGEEWRINRL